MPGVFFLKIGAPSVEKHEWQTISLPRLWKYHRRRSIFAVKYDCEGCEYALARHDDAAQREEMLEMLLSVHQLNLELHFSTSYLDTHEKLRNLASLLQLLHAAGMQLAAVDKGGCGGHTRGMGPEVRYCPDEFYEAGVPCDISVDCSCFLFVRHGLWTART